MIAVQGGMRPGAKAETHTQGVQFYHFSCQKHHILHVMYDDCHEPYTPSVSYSPFFLTQKQFVVQKCPVKANLLSFLVFYICDN